LPHKFGYDKRRAHYSSLIAAGQLSRQDALEMLKQPLYNNQIDLENDVIYLCNKFEITRDYFDKIMALPIKTINDYSNDSKYFYLLIKLAKFILRRK
jgi:hypothetical protein